MKILVETFEGFNIYFEALEEHSLIDENFSDNEELRKDTLKQLQGGSLVKFCAKVSAVKEDIELGDDYLGMCIYENEEDFYTKYKEEYYNDMKNRVVSEAKIKINKLVV